MAYIKQTQAYRRIADEIADLIPERERMEFEELRAAAQRGRYLLLGAAVTALFLIYMTNQII